MAQPFIASNYVWSLNYSNEVGHVPFIIRKKIKITTTITILHVGSLSL